MFQEQFTPVNPRRVDMSILEEVPQQDKRTFPRFAVSELQEALRSTSNFAAPGPDNVSRFELKRIITLALALFPRIILTSRRCCNSSSSSSRGRVDTSRSEGHVGCSWLGPRTLKGTRGTFSDDAGSICAHARALIGRGDAVKEGCLPDPPASLVVSSDASRDGCSDARRCEKRPCQWAGCGGGVEDGEWVLTGVDGERDWEGAGRR